MRKAMKYLAVFAIPHALIVYFCLIAIFLNLASPFLNGFAVDSTGRVYVGENKYINVYESCVKVGCIELEDATFRFSIDENDHILVAYTSEVCFLDLSGKVLERQEDAYAHTFNKIQLHNLRSVTVGDNHYKKVSVLGWTRVVRNNTEVVYELSVLSFVVKMLLFVCPISMLINGLWVITYGHKKICEERKETKDGAREP